MSINNSVIARFVTKILVGPLLTCTSNDRAKHITCKTSEATPAVRVRKRKMDSRHGRLMAAALVSFTVSCLVIFQ
jgi:hypothetical protein